MIYNVLKPFIICTYYIFDKIYFRYGTEVGSVTENALTAVGNTYLTAYNATALGPKALAKRAAKTAGKVTVGVSEEAILGRTVAPNLPEIQQDLTEDSTQMSKRTKTIEHKPDQ